MYKDLWVMFHILRIEGFSDSYGSGTLENVHVSTVTCNLSLCQNTDRQTAERQTQQSLHVLKFKH